MICTVCKIDKKLEHFFERKNSKKGYYSQCKECQYFNKKQYNIKNKDKISKQKSEYYLKNKKHIDQRIKKYSSLNKKNLQEYRKKYQIKNKEKIAEYNKKWTQENKEKINNRLKERRIIDLNYKISSNLRSRIRNAIKIGNKKNTTKNLIGCSIEELKKHLESNFRDGMTWENYGQYWHIDHIRPCASYDLTIYENQIECFNYKNLQPLLKEENLRKNNKWNCQQTQM